MKERPILFSGPMVRALLDGRKTQTRRVVKPQPPSDQTWVNCLFRPTSLFQWSDEPKPEGSRACVRWPAEHGVACPYGAPGDRLWVRENFWRVEIEGGGIDNQFIVYDEEWTGGRGAKMPKPAAIRPVQERGRFGHIPSIHMPRWASRITLEVTGVRVERLQNCSESDAFAEGVDGVMGTARSQYADLWCRINGPGSWAANPWVWAIEFKRVSQ